MIDTIEYPKTYRPTLLLRFMAGIIAIALCGSGLLVAAAGSIDGSSCLAGALFVALGLYLAAASLVSKVTLYEDRIEQAGALGVRELRCEDIQGYRVRKVKNATYFDLIPVDGRLKKISVEKKFFEDTAFIAWALNIPGLDALDRLAVDLEIARDESLGATPEQRKAKVQMLKKFALYLSLGYLVVATVVAVYPHPEWLALAVIASGPWIAIAMVFLSKENFTIVETEHKIGLRKGSLLQMLLFPMVPIIALFTSQVGDSFRFPLDWHPLLLPALAGGVAMTGVIWLASRSDKVNFPVLLSMSLPMILYAGGLLALANSAFDQQDARNFALTVVDKHRTTGKGAADFFTVTSSDPAYIGQSSVKVPYKLYTATDVGGTVCGQIHPGFLGMSWETVGWC